MTVILLPLLLVACGGVPSLEDARTFESDGQSALDRGRQLQAEGRMEEAGEAYQEAQDLLLKARDAYLGSRADISGDPEVLREFAVLSERLLENDLAGKAYEKAATVSGTRRDWYLAGRNLATVGGAYADAAVEALHNALGIAYVPGQGSDAQILTALGDVYWGKGIYELAEENYTAALVSDPAEETAAIGQAACGIARGDLSEVGAILARGSTLDAGEADRLDRMFREAYLDMRRLRVGVESTVDSQRNLASLEVQLGFLEEARLAIEEALSLGSDDVFSWNLAGSLAQREGDDTRAREAFGRSLEIDPTQVRTREALEILTRDK